MKTIRHLFATLLCVVALALPAAAQNLEVVSRANDLVTLTPAAPFASRTLLLDASPRVHLIVTAAATDLTVVFVSPGGTRYTVGMTAPNFDSLINPSTSVTGANYHGILLNPTPGNWRVEVSSPAPPAKLDAAITTLFGNKVGLALVGGHDTKPAGVLTPLSLAVLDDAVKVGNLQITATTFAPDGSAAPVTFRDDGVSPDATAGDRIYSAGVVGAIAGEHQVTVAVRGTASTGSFVRTAQTQFRATRRTALFDGTFTDNGVDDDADGSLDGIYVAPRISITEAGTYVVSVKLRSAGGKTIQRSFRGALGIGTAAPQVRFHLDDIVKVLAENGPYAVTFVEAMHETAPGAPETVDRRVDLGNTKPYTLTQFQNERLRVVGGTATGVDFNGNGLYDQLQINLQVATDVSGFFTFTGSLTDRNGANLGLYSSSRSLSVGTHTLTLTFNGRTIGENNVDGPYDLAFLMFGGGQSLVAPRAFSTQAFLSSQFEGGRPRDTTPPVLGVTVTPAELWPANHQMIEITPSISVSDNMDPNPVVELVSVTSNQGTDVHGDGHTSPDVDLSGGRIQLRAERSGIDEDRVYTLTWTARDASGNQTTTTATVTVPHDQRKK